MSGSSVGKLRARTEYRDGIRQAVSDSRIAANGEQISTFRTVVVRIPDAARLDFGIAVESEDSPAAPQVRFTLDLVSNGQRTTIYDAEYSQLPSRDSLKGWEDISIDLAHHAGEEASFEFAVNFGSPGDEPDEYAALWGSPLLFSSASVPRPLRPNVIIISLDTLRADHLSSYGYARDTSPNIDRFAQEAVLFENCFAPTSWTTPSHASIFTGLHPVVHQATRPYSFHLREDLTTLAELLQAEGALTAAFTEGVSVGGQLGFFQGFDRYSNGMGILPLPSGSAEHIFENAADWLSRYGHLPFFLFVHTYEIHAPYQPPPPYDAKFGDPPQIPERNLQNRSERTKEQNQAIEKAIRDHLRAVDSPVLQQQAIDQYDGEIAYTDAVVGRFLEGLAKLGHLDDTVIVILSDHGEEFWEHGSIWHAQTLYDEVLRVPLIVRPPGGAVKPGRVMEMVTLADVFKTVLDFTGIENTASMQSRSLMPLIDKTVSAEPPPPRPIVGLLYRSPNDSLGDPIRGDLRSIRTHDRKLVVSDLDAVDENGDAIETPNSEPTEELYDLRGDPRELENLAGASPPGLQTLRDELRNFFKEAEKHPLAINLDTAEIPTLTEEERDELRVMGYL